MSRWRFYLSWLKEAFFSPLPKVRLIGFFLAIIGGGIPYLFPDLESPVRSGVWAASAGVFVAAIMIGLVTAPYTMCRELFLRVKLLEERMAPRLNIIGVQESNMGYWGSGWALEVRNRGTEPAKGCHGRLEDIDFETPLENLSLNRWPKLRDLHWSGQLENSYDYYSERFIGDTGVTFPSYEANSDGNKVSPIITPSGK